MVHEGPVLTSRIILNTKPASYPTFSVPFSAPSKRRIFVGLLVLQVIFALGYILSKVLVDEFPPLIWAWMRAGITAIFMGLITLLMKRPHPQLNLKFFGPLILLSILGGVLTQVFFLVGLKHTTSTNSAVLNTLNPLIILLTVILMGREKVTPLRVVGFLVSFLGVLIVSGAEKMAVGSATLYGDLLTLANCLTYGVFVAVSRDFFKIHDRLWVTTWLFVFTTIGLTFFALPEMSAFHWPVMTPSLWGAFLYGILGSSLVGYFLVVWVLAHAPASQVALSDYIQPILVALLASVFLGEQPTLRMVSGTGLIFLGVLLTLEHLPVGFRFIQPRLPTSDALPGKKSEVPTL